MININNHRRANHSLRVIAVLGVIIVTYYKFFSLSGVKSNQEYGFLALIIVGIGLFISFMVLKSSFLKVLRNPDLLVPVAIYITFNFLFGIFIKTSGYIGFKDGSFRFEYVTLAATTAFLLQIVISTCFAGWMTRTILDFVENDRVDLFGSLQNFREWFPRSLAALIFGMVPIYLILFIILPLMFQLNRLAISSVIYGFIFFVVVVSLVWNLMTATLMPHVLSSQSAVKTAIVEGMKISWLNKRKTLVPVLLLMMTAGSLVFLFVTYDDPIVENKPFGEYTYTGSYSTKSQWNLSSEFVWVGDYQESSKWHSAMMSMIKQEPLETVSFRLMILMLILSLVVNLEIISRYMGKNAVSPPIDSVTAFNTKVVVIAGVFALFFPVEFLLSNFYSSKAGGQNLTNAAVLSAPKVFTDEKILVKQPLFASTQLPDERSNTIFVGNFDGREGIEKVVLYGAKALVYDERENLVNEIKFSLGKTQSGDKLVDLYFKSVKVTDFDDDGIFEFVGISGYANSAVVVNQKGEVVWEYDDEKIDVENVEVVDIDNDKQKEIIAYQRGLIKIFNRQGKEIKSLEINFGKSYGATAHVVNDSATGEKRFLMSNFGDAVLISLDGKQSGKIEMPTNISGFLIDDDRTAHSLYFNHNEFGLFSMKGDVEARHKAPFSQIGYSYWEKKFSDAVLDKYYVISAEARRFKTNQEGSNLLAVMANIGGAGYDYKDMLYVYDETGRLVYQELMVSSFSKLHIAPSETKIGAEDLVIIEDRNIWKYTTQ